MKALLLLALYFAACVLVSALLGLGLPFPEVPDVRDKIEWLARHGDDYDVLFLGSSRVQQQMLPTIFDRVAAENGAPVHSFNAGIPAMTSPEDGYVLEEILRRPHRRLRWVLVELTSFDNHTGGEDTSRFTYWHDSTRLGFMARGLRLQLLAKLKRFRRNPAATMADKCQAWTTMGSLLWPHLRAWFIRGASLNRGGEILDRWLHAPGSHHDPRQSLGEFGDGWTPAGHSYQQMSADMRSKYEHAYADRLATPARAERGNAVAQAPLERLLDAITAAGARPVLIVPPMVVTGKPYPTEEREQEVPILDFSDVRQYVPLFTPEHRSDLTHLNVAGSEIYTDLIARRFAELAKSHSPKP